MPRARMIPVDYFGFRQLVREGSKSGGVIRPEEKSRWEGYISSHAINEFAALSIGKSRMVEPATIVLDMGGESDGLYVYSETDEVCLRMVFQD